VEDFPLKFDAANIDLGETETHFEHSFTFHNDSEDTITNIKLSSTCGCTKMTITPESIAPHQKGHVLLEIDQTGKRLGQQIYLAVVKYHVKQRRCIQPLSIKTNHGDGVSMTPNQMEIDSYLDETLIRKISMIDTRRQPLEIKEIITSDSWLECNIAEKPVSFNNGWSYVLETIIKHSDLEHGKYQGSIAIKTNDESYPLFNVRVIFNKLSPIIVSTNKVILFQKGESFEGNCNVWHRDRVPIKMSVISDDPVKTTLQTDHETNESLVSFSFPVSEIKTVPFSQMVKLKVESPCQMEIPVTLSVSQSY
jgi:hypothetical protein